MDAFLESESESESNTSDINTTTTTTSTPTTTTNTTNTKNIDSSSDNNNNSSSDDEIDYNFTLDDIDWNKVSKSMGTNVEIIPSKDKNTPPLLIKKPYPVCNEPLLKQKFNELQSKTKSLNWFETLTISTKSLTKKATLQSNKLKNNDIKREIFFYKHTLESVKIALEKNQNRNSKWYKFNST
eukprot:772888_1